MTDQRSTRQDAAAVLVGRSVSIGDNRGIHFTTSYNAYWTSSGVRSSLLRAIGRG